MTLQKILSQKRSAVLKRWFELILQTYPQESRNFLKKQKNRFANPVGQSILEGMNSIYDELLQETESGNVSLFLDNIIRVRAVQDFAPSQAVGFIFGLRRIIKEELGREILQEGIFEEWTALESRIDGLALLCFDIYTQCRQKIFDIRVNEVRSQSSRLLKMAGLVYEIPETEADLEEGKRE